MFISLFGHQGECVSDAYLEIAPLSFIIRLLATRAYSCVPLLQVMCHRCSSGRKYIYEMKTES